jgi:ectoine hydroxylase-related dioxygenase (phytanoyl-CoA dioxygenase family)
VSTAADRAVADYRRDGVGVLRSWLALDRVESLRAGCERAWERALADRADQPAVAERLFLRLDAAGRRHPDRLEPVADLDAALASFVLDPEVTSLVAAVIGAPVWVLKDKLIRKAAGMDGYGPHQDHGAYAVAGISADRLVSVFVPLVEAPPGAGPLEVAMGRHASLLQPAGSLDLGPHDVAGHEWTAVELAPGDVALLHPLAPHHSAPNRSDRARSMLVVTYGSGPGGAAAAQTLREHYRRTVKAEIDGGGSGALSPRNG